MRRGRRRAEVLVPVASIGDIAFLLIIFFILCSNFMREEKIRAQLPASAQIDPIKPRQIFVSIDADGAIYLQGESMYDAEELEMALGALLEGKEGENRTVLLKCDKGVENDVFEPVLSAMAEAGALIACVGEKSEQP